MRSIVKTVIFLLLPLYSLATEGFVIKGKVTGIISGSVSIIDNSGEMAQQGILPPKVRIVNGEFTFTGKLDHPQLVNLKVSTRTISVFLENTTYTIDCSLDSLNATSLKGGILNDQFIAYLESNIAPMEYMKVHPSLEIAAWHGLRYATSQDKAQEAYDLLTPANKNSWYGKAILAKIESFKLTGAGTALPELSLVAPNDKPFSIKDMAGKVVVLDFWASWCAPCRAYIPTMREHYNKFKDKGVVFISVSVDEDNAKWHTAMDELKMEWLQGLTTGGLKPGEGVQKTLNISSIPHVVIVGKDGRIAVSLDYSKKDQLEKELEKLL